jgi:exopolysaccharide biosynthesis protein
MRNSVKIWIIAICVMQIMVLTGVVGWTIGYQDHKKIGQSSKNLSEMTEETKEEMIQETTVAMTEEMTEETTEKITEETQARTEEPGENEQSAVCSGRYGSADFL